MKHDLKISRLAIICVLCTAVSGAYGASSVRALGGAGTYASASDAAAAGSGSAANSTASVRGGSLRVTPNSGASGTSTSISTSNTTSGRVATTPRLSIGHYLGGGTAVSGGSSLRPSGGGSSSSGGGSSSGGDTNPDVSGLRQDVDDLMREVEDLHTADSDIHESIDILRDETQGKLIPGADGYIIIEDDNEIFVDVDALQGALETVAGEDGREVELGSNDTHLLWRYVGEGNDEWRELIAKADITGPQGEKGEPGDPANLDAYSTTEQMNAAIGAAIANLADTYATVQYVDGELSTKADKATTLAGYGIRDAMNREEITKAIADATSDIVGSEEIEQFKTDVAGLKTTVGDANSGLVKDVNDLSGAVTALDGEMDTVSQLAGSAASTASAAASDAAEALSGLADKEDKANKKTTLTNSDTDYPSTSAVTAALATKANVDDVPTTVAELTDASNYVTTDGLSGAISTATENMVTDTELTDALAGKADKATTLAGYGITDAYTTAQIDEKLEDVAVGGMEGMEQVLAGKQDVSNLVQVVSEADTTKYPSGAAVYKELETKANASDLANYATTETVNQIEQNVTNVTQTVTQLGDTINNAETGLAAKVDDAVAAATEAKEAADAATSAVAGKQDALGFTPENVANKSSTVVDDESKYPSSAAVYGELETKANVSDLANYATTETVNQIEQNVTNVTQKVDEITNPDTGLASQVTNITNVIGDEDSGLVKDVADAMAAADKASQDVAGKQDALTTEQLNAVNSGITAEKVSVYDGYADDIAGKQDALGYTAENAANKTDDMTADTGSTTKYPTVHAVEAYVTNTVAEGVEINTDQIAAGAVKTDQIGDGAVTEEKLSGELNAEIDGKEDKANLKALAYKDQIRDADVAADAAISKSKLATDVQNALDNAANAVAAPAGEKTKNSVLGTDGEGNPVWYEIAM